MQQFRDDQAMDFDQFSAWFEGVAGGTEVKQLAPTSGLRAGFLQDMPGTMSNQQLGSRSSGKKFSLSSLADQLDVVAARIGSISSLPNLPHRSRDESQAEAIAQQMGNLQQCLQPISNQVSSQNMSSTGAP